ncbi:MAG: hypothetical protein KAH56_12075 [Candidatus Krumholzibacteria bacterium]|nr:hypothetical protein [Candidatus Krumholzibacteria bacterium]
MRWIDIILPEPTIHQELDTRLAAAARLAAEIPPLQDQYGLDSVRVIEIMTKAGQELFQGIIAADPEAFSSSRGSETRETPALGQPEHDELVGYHIVASPARVGLPWSWLHNGVGFLFEKHPICCATHGSGLPEGSLHRPWMQRLTRARFLVGEEGGDTLTETIAQLRPDDVGRPEILFVPGHTDRKRRKLIYREAELIEAAIEHGCRGETLLDLDLPLEPVTPSDLVTRGLQYQAIHFAGPTSQPARQSDPFGEFWMNCLIEETTLPDARELEDALGMEGEVLGVDPVTSLLDDIVKRYETAGSVLESVTVGGGGIDRQAFSGIPAPNAPSRSWLLDDGPVNPENMERWGTLPPLIFSNSYKALPELGHRFVRSGASTFIGPVVPLFSRPARIFAGHCYGAMGEGWGAAAAVWKASRTCRQELGVDHPAWLSYGIQGYGQLALQYL